MNEKIGGMDYSYNEENFNGGSADEKLPEEADLSTAEEISKDTLSRLTEKNAEATAKILGWKQDQKKTPAVSEPEEVRTAKYLRPPAFFKKAFPEEGEK